MTMDTTFTCSESPLKFPQLMDIQRIYPCISCKLRLNSQIPGPGTVVKHETGLLLNENPQTTLSINGIQHHLIESFIYIPGAHRLPGQGETSVLEVALYFRTEDGQKCICLCIPVQVGGAANDESNMYFASLNEIVRNRPTIGNLVSPTSAVLSYRGADMRGRDGRNSRPRQLCDPLTRTVMYYVLLTSATISAAEYQRLKKISDDANGPPKPITELIESRYKLLTRIDGINVIKAPTPTTASTKSTNGGVSTKAVKCYRLNKEKDIVDNKIYIGHPGSTLESELTKSDATQADGEDSRDTSIQPGDIEKWIGIIVGSVVALLIIAFGIYMVWSGTFRDYVKVQKMYDSPLPKTFGEVKWGPVKMPAFLCPSAPPAK